MAAALIPVDPIVKSTILLLGVTGVGKSTIANYLTNTTKFTTSGERKSCTSTCHHEYSDELKCNVMDPPGLRDTRNGGATAGGVTAARFDRDTITSDILQYCRKHKLEISLAIIVIDRLPRVREDNDVTFLLNMIKALAPGMASRVVFACSNDEKPEDVIGAQRGWPGHKCLQFVWGATGYIFPKSIVTAVMKSPIQPLWDEKQCTDCKKMASPRIPEPCNTHWWSKKHLPKKHIIGHRHAGPMTSGHSGAQSFHHHGVWSGGLFGQGWTCCGRGRGHFTWNHNDCTIPKHVCDANCGSRCTSCNRRPEEAPCTQYCTSCQVGNLQLAGCYCPHPGCNQDVNGGCQVHCANPACGNPSGDGCLPKRSHTFA